MELARSTQEKRPDTNARISVLENNVTHLSGALEKLETKIDSNYATLHSRISDLRDDLRGDFETKHERVIQKLEEHNQNSISNGRELNNRIAQIEKWRWMIMGAAMVLGYILAHLKFEQLF